MNQENWKSTGGKGTRQLREYEYEEVEINR